ncbi:hypothetical protein V1478_017083 [Vespula squamosa]|uniref:Uncharacterized protein n=1 Tax=Vespula squamosa TaxID=30214 RepID=A0ABD1ZYD3_VESSQ
MRFGSISRCEDETSSSQLVLAVGELVWAGQARITQSFLQKSFSTTTQNDVRLETFELVLLFNLEYQLSRIREYNGVDVFAVVTTSGSQYQEMQKSFRKSTLQAQKVKEVIFSYQSIPWVVFRGHDTHAIVTSADSRLPYAGIPYARITRTGELKRVKDAHLTACRKDSLKNLLANKEEEEEEEKDKQTNKQTNERTNERSNKNRR